MDTPIPPVMEQMIDRILTPDSPQQAIMDFNWWGHSAIAMPQGHIEVQSEYEIITGDEE